MKRKNRRKIKIILAGIAIYAVASLANMTTYNNFRSKSVDYALDMPVLADYHNLVLETEKCSVLEKLSVLRLCRQKEAQLLCTFKDSIPRETQQHIKNFKNIYVVGDMEDDLVQDLESKGFRVLQYKGITGFIKTVY